MKIEKREISVRDIVKNYKDLGNDGVFGYDGKLDIRPAFQREFVYKEKQRNEVINTVYNGFPLNTIYWAKKGDNFELLDGQQRTISICQFVNNKFSMVIRNSNVNQVQRFENLSIDEQKKILDYKLDVYICDGTDSEKLAWFKVINIAGEVLTEQEIRNAVFKGTWLSDAKPYFSKNNCGCDNRYGEYFNVKWIRQEGLETVIKWIGSSQGLSVDEYMGIHQNDPDASDLKDYINNVFDWVNKILPINPDKNMKGLPWGEYYNKYKDIEKDLSSDYTKLLGDLAVENKKKIIEYLLEKEKGNNLTQLLEIRIFDKNTKLAKYTQQTNDAKAKGISNCPLCAVGNNANKNRIYKFEEMDADHVTAWSNGGASDISNCEMLCSSHNKAKGNK